MKNRQNYVVWTRTRVRMCTGGKFNYASYISSKMLKLSLIPVYNVHFKYFVEIITWKELLRSVVLCKRTRIFRIRLWSMFYNCQVNIRLEKCDFKTKVKFKCHFAQIKSLRQIHVWAHWCAHFEWCTANLTVYIRTSNSYQSKV